MDKLFHPTLYDGCNYLSMLGLKLKHVSDHKSRNGIAAKLIFHQFGFWEKVISEIGPCWKHEKAWIKFYLVTWNSALVWNFCFHGWFASSFKSIVFKLITQISSLATYCNIAVRWMPQNLTNEKSTLVRIMVWCLEATSHYYTSQFWPRSMSPYAGLILVLHQPMRENVTK